jgi:hypothetical protein
VIYVLDADPMIALLNSEPGADVTGKPGVTVCVANNAVWRVIERQCAAAQPACTDQRSPILERVIGIKSRPAFTSASFQNLYLCVSRITNI